MATIYKYPLNVWGKTTVPDGQVVHFGKDNQHLVCAWISHSAEQMIKRDPMINLYVVGTGVNFNDDDMPLLTYIDEGGFVWHLIMDWQTADV